METHPVRPQTRRLFRCIVMPELPGGAKHGTRSLYMRGCRCDPCTDADSLYSRERKRRTR